jgi:hypothetical protein
VEAAFWWKLALSFLTGSTWVALSATAAERCGSAVGGLIGGLPSTMVVSLLFIGLTQSSLVAAETTTLMPLVQGINGLFVVVYLALARRGLTVGLLGGLSAWVVVAGGVASIGVRHIGVSLGGWVLLVVGCVLVVERWLVIPPAEEVRVQCTPVQMAGRALLGGSTIAASVAASKLLGPVYGGILAAFPATFLSTLVITHRSGGVEFSRAVGRAMMLSGMVNAALYPVAVRYLYVWPGLAAGTVLALAFSCATATLTYRLLRSAAAP